MIYHLLETTTIDMEEVLSLIQQKHLLVHNIDGIHFVTTPQQEGITVAKEILYQTVNPQTLLLLSGGKTPKDFYSVLANEETIIPGAVGQIDERFGEPYHPKSNELMMQESGLLRYLQMRDIPFYPILSHHAEREVLVNEYDTKLRELFNHYTKSIGLLGIGLDGHTAGIPADPEVWKEFDIAQKGKTEYVVDYDDHDKFYRERITVTFLGLSMLDLLIVMVFGNDKMNALQQMLQDGSEEEVPSRFYKRPDIAKKTLIITDQRI